jgi:hypothetical protein
LRPASGNNRTAADFVGLILQKALNKPMKSDTMMTDKKTNERGTNVMTIKDRIHEIEDATEELLVPKHQSDHLAKELLQDLLDKAMTEEEVQAIEDKYIKHFDEDEILKIIHGAKLSKGFIKE